MQKKKISLKVKQTKIKPKRRVIKPKQRRGNLFAKGNQTAKGHGRPVGSKNKFTSLKQAFLDVFVLLDGVNGMHLWAKKSSDNQKAFYGWIVRLLPREVNLGNSDINPNELNNLKDEELDTIIRESLKG